MKFIVCFVVILALSKTAAAEPVKLQFRNLFRESLRPVSSNTQPRIIGGYEVEPNSLPYQAFLEVHTENQAAYCGGSIISQNYILTAAHCIVGLVEARVFLGRHDLSTQEATSFYVISTNITTHAQYDAAKIHYDVGLIRLPEPLNFTDAIQPVKLPSRAQANESFVDQIAKVSGWGRTDGFVAGISYVLNAVDVKIISNAECARDYAILDSNICISGDQMTSSCSGDSGGPLVLGGVQLGVVSFGIQNCLPGYPSALSRLTSFLDWIQDNSDAVVV